MSTNLVGSILCTREALRIMGSQRNGGHVFNMDGAGSGGSSTPLTAVWVSLILEAIVFPSKLKKFNSIAIDSQSKINLFSCFKKIKIWINKMWSSATSIVTPEGEQKIESGHPHSFTRHGSYRPAIEVFWIYYVNVSYCVPKFLSLGVHL